MYAQSRGPHPTQAPPPTGLRTSVPIYNVRQYTGHTYVYVEAADEREALAIAHAAPADA